jgi:recombinational DNA repair protein (RecF pathway)
MIKRDTTEEKTVLFSNPSEVFEFYKAFYVHLKNKVTEKRLINLFVFLQLLDHLGGELERKHNYTCHHLLKY